MGTAMFGISVDTKHLDSGVTHALELEGMDYKFTVSIPQEAIVPPGHTKPEPDPPLDMVFYNDVLPGSSFVQRESDGAVWPRSNGQCFQVRKWPVFMRHSWPKPNT